MKRTLWLLLTALLLCPYPPVVRAKIEPLSAMDFAVELPGGIFNMASDTREDLERVTDQTFEFFDEFPQLGIAYDRLITGAVNFFAAPDAKRVNQISFTEGSITARGIGLGASQAEVFAAYGEPPGLYNEHGYIRIEYALSAGEHHFALQILIYEPDDCVVDLLMNGYGPDYSQ